MLTVTIVYDMRQFRKKTKKNSSALKPLLNVLSTNINKKAPHYTRRFFIKMQYNLQGLILPGRIGPCRMRRLAAVRVDTPVFHRNRTRG